MATKKASSTSQGSRFANMDSEIRRTAERIKQLSDPTRLYVLELLRDQELNVSQICEELGIQSQPAVSHHLALLRHGLLIEPRRRGKNNFYTLTSRGRVMSDMVQNVMESA